MKKILAILLTTVMCFGLAACGGGQQKDDVYGIGDTWEVEDQWKFTINSVTTTDERNQFAETDPVQVVIVDYTYENLGYDHQLLNGLYIDPIMGEIRDGDGNACQSYPVTLKNYPQEVPIGETCHAQLGIGLMSDKNTFSIDVLAYGENGESKTALFELEF